ncbi:hypothetical protein L3C95_34640 [Chitinophaga filiformis]|uniref:hypothetical protein n=1 Tax=Chitinophaga filiformis TaxID=104663 RepID=UPI001F27A265|nr:hypothetical protein [Chitinophaga filiformis]MCF6408078.1 hypothetical protein [Chitinophaga filiformis]
MQAFKINFPVKLDCIKDPLDDNIDANLILADGSVYVATLFTIANIQGLMEQNDLPYFLATDMVIVRELTKSTIRAALEEILKMDEEGIKMTSSYIGTIEKQYSHCFPEGVSFELIEDETLE